VKKSHSRQSKSLLARTLTAILVASLWGCAPTTVTETVTEQQESAANTQETEVEVPLVLAARFKIKPEKRDLFIQLATDTLEPTRKEPGVISYSFYEEANVPNSFIYFEEWESRAALDKHLKQPYVTRLLDKFPEMLAEEANIRIYDIKDLTFGLE